MAPVRPVIDPSAACLDELAGTDCRRMADDGDQVALAPCLHPQHAEPAVFIVKANALDETGEVFAVGWRAALLATLLEARSAPDTDWGDRETTAPILHRSGSSSGSVT